MTKHFENEIDRLKKKVLYLTAMVERSLQTSVKAIINRDDSAVTAVQELDNEIDTLEVEVEEDCLKILALHQPVAADLRFVIAVLKINNDLERIGDLSVNISKRIKYFAPFSDRKVPFDLDNMLERTSKMVHMSADALIAWDPEKAKEICEADNAIDEIHKQAYKEIHKHIQSEPEFVEYYISLLSVSRNLERIADHATNIAEDIVYMVSGEIIRHQGGNL
ncbi:MAG: phosphate transport system regulatory protein PhoU [Calditrichaeota bacterium]|nr:MAG: phosphate transport system regulatory protein PhoU [Calditrichota bacterium]